MRTLTPHLRRAVLAAVLALAAAVTVTSLSACGGAYTPVKEGKCAPGRVWVPPHQDENGNWVDGRCAWPDQVEKE